MDVRESDRPAGIGAAHPPAASAPPISTRRVVTIFLAITFVAFILRMIHLDQASRLPSFYSLISDARSYDEWSRRIAAGDWLGREVFYQAPLYPYFLAVTQLVTGHDLWRMRVVQAALGSIACGLLFLAGRRFAGPWAGACAGGLAAVYPPAIFFDGLIQKTVLDMFLMCLLLWLLALWPHRRTIGIALLVGIVLGCFALTRENVLVFVPIIAVWLVRRSAPPSIHRRMAAVGAFAAGLALVLVPVGLRNKYIGGAFLMTTAQLGPNFFIGNHEHATGCYVPLRPGREDPAYERADAADIAEQAVGRKLTPAEVSDFWLSKALTWIRSHPGDWLRLLGRKCRFLCNAYEVPDIEDIYYYMSQCSLLRRLGGAAHFGIIAPLAVGGMVLTWRRRRELWILHALLLALAVGLLAFYLAGRYRFPMAPILILFAAFGVVEGAVRVRRCDWRGIAAACTAVGMVSIPINWPLISHESHTAMAHINMGHALLAEGKVDAAVHEFVEAVRMHPSLPAAHVSLSNAYGRLGRWPEAITACRKAMELRPDDLEIRLNLGGLLSSSGEYVEAEPHLRAALAIASRRPDVFNNLGVLLIRQKKWGEAIEVFRRGAREAPSLLIIRANLAWNLATCPVDEHRDGPAAVRIAEACCSESGYRDPLLLDILGAAYAEVGRFDDAVAAAQRATRLAAGKSNVKGAAEFPARLHLYQSNKPYRRPP